MKIRLGIIGVGNMGRGHIQSIMSGQCPDIEAAAAADIIPERLNWVKETVPSAKTFTDAAAMMDSGIVDAVLVATPHYAHPELAIAAFARNLHVMVEKPAGVYTKQVRAMNAAAAKSGAVFGLMFNQRTDHIYRKMRELIHSGTLGTLRRTNWIITNWYRSQAYYDSGGWRATWAGEGGGVLLNQCPHNLDLWQWICGMPCLVDARIHCGKWHDIEVEDDVTAYVEYPNGATGVFVTSTADYPGTNRFEITLSGGKLVAEDGKLTLWKNTVDEEEFNRLNTSPFSSPDCVCTGVETDGLSLQHPAVLNAFAGAILRGESLLAGGAEGINELTLSNAMYLSAWTEKPVRIDMEDGVPRIDEELFLTELKKRAALSRHKEGSGFVADVKNTFGGM